MFTCSFIQSRNVGTEKKNQWPHLPLTRMLFFHVAKFFWIFRTYWSYKSVVGALSIHSIEQEYMRNRECSSLLELRKYHEGILFIPLGNILFTQNNVSWHDLPGTWCVNAWRSFARHCVADKEHTRCSSALLGGCLPMGNLNEFREVCAV